MIGVTANLLTLNDNVASALQVAVGVRGGAPRHLVVPRGCALARGRRVGCGARYVFLLAKVGCQDLVDLDHRVRALLEVVVAAGTLLAYIDVIEVKNLSVVVPLVGSSLILDFFNLSNCLIVQLLKH